MNLEELKKLREEKFLAHKRKKREYYLKKKQIVKKVYDYDIELNDENFISNEFKSIFFIKIIDKFIVKGKGLFKVIGINFKIR